MADSPVRKPSSRTPAPPSRTPLPGDDPFRFNNRTLPITRMPLPVHQKRILVLVAVALVLAVIGALVGTRLLTRPRQVRTTVRGDMQALDARIWDTVSCLGGAETHKDGRDLPKHLLERALRLSDWPARIETCRRKTALLLAASSAVTASANAAPSRVPEAIRLKYRHVLTAAGRIHEAVSQLAADASAGQRLPRFDHCLAVARAVGRYQKLLGDVERLADLPKPRSAPPELATEPPAWTVPSTLSKGIPASRGARFRALQPGRAHVALWLDDPLADTTRLLLNPAGRTRWLPLPSPPPGAVGGQPLRWLQVLAAPAGAAPPRLLWAQATWDARLGRGGLLVGDTGAPKAESVAWPRLRGLAGRIHGGGAEGGSRWLLASAVSGATHTLLWLTRKDAGPWSKPVVLATDLVRPEQLRIWPGRTPTRITYPVAGGGTALGRLARPDGKAPARVVLDTGAGAARALCGTDTVSWMLDSRGRLWHRPGPGRAFVSQPWPGAEAADTRLLCVGPQAALAWRDDTGRHHYVLCSERQCQAPQLVSWSRLRTVRLTPSRRGVLVLAADDTLLFARRDPRVSGRLQPPTPVTRFSAPPREIRVLRDPGVPGRITVLLRGVGLGRLRSNDGGVTWAGE